jgi:hypothetical protein
MRATFSAYQTRLSLEHNVLPDRTESYPGQEPRAEYPKVNRDPDVFGPDATGFNPNRPSPADGTPRYGLGFGVGTHQCFGLRVAVGNDGKGGAHVTLIRTCDLWVMSYAPRVFGLICAGQRGWTCGWSRLVALIWGGFAEFCSQICSQICGQRVQLMPSP